MDVFRRVHDAGKDVTNKDLSIYSYNCISSQYLSGRKTSGKVSDKLSLRITKQNRITEGISSGALWSPCLCENYDNFWASSISI